MPHYIESELKKCLFRRVAGIKWHDLPRVSEELRTGEFQAF